MKRSKALAALSRDHHQALVVAQKLRRATAATACEARDAFLAYWTGHGREHFRLEEELLFPAYAGYGDPHDPLVLRALGQHVMIRHHAAALAHVGTALPASLEQLGAELAAHVRLEEREVFPLIERVMPTHELEAVARELESAKHACWSSGWQPADE
jgi:iron-sulfur cluster repair protein YtfE (RIC family)